MLLVVCLAGASCKNCDRNKPNANSGQRLLKKSQTLSQLEQPRFSESVNGLVANIEWVDLRSYSADAILVRLKNVSVNATRVPTGNRVDEKWDDFDNAGLGISGFVGTRAEDKRWPDIFELYLRSRDGWSRTPWVKVPGAHVITSNSCQMTGNYRNRPTVTLQPGESALAYLCGAWSTDNDFASELKVVFSQKAGSTEDWQGKITTPPYAFRNPNNGLDTRKRSLPFPDHFPDLSHVRASGWNMSFHESTYTMLSASNGLLLGHLLELYPAGEVTRNLLEAITAEKDPHLRILIAEAILCFGSPNNTVKQIFTRALLEAPAGELSYPDGKKSSPWPGHGSGSPVSSTAVAAVANVAYCKSPPSWIGEELMHLLQTETRADFRVSIPRSLAEMKYVAAIPLMRTFAEKNPNNDEVINALAELAGTNERGLLLRLFRSGKIRDDRTVVRALARLKITEAVPDLIKKLPNEYIIDALVEFRDPSTLPALRKIAAGRGDNARKAEIAIVIIEDADPTKRLTALLSDTAIDEFIRRDILWYWGWQPTPSAVEPLLVAIKTDPSGVIVNQAITVLSAFPYKSTVIGLIDCLGADFRNKSDWKRAYNQKMYRDNIADSLRTLTGKSFSSDKTEWQRWWNTEGENNFRPRSEANTEK